MLKLAVTLDMHAPSSYDMFLNLSTTRVNGGWMCFKINNDDYMQLSASDNKVNIYKYTTISGNLDVGVNQSQSTIIAYTNHGASGNQGYSDLKANSKDLATISFTSNLLYGAINISLNSVRFFRMPSWND